MEAILYACPAGFQSAIYRRMMAFGFPYSFSVVGEMELDMRILGVDFGDTRTGLAVCDINESLASPAGTIIETDIKKTAKAVAEKARELGVSRIVIGYPKNMNGTIGKQAEKVKVFTDMLKNDFGFDTVLWDERCTTLSAHRIFNETDTRGKKRKAAVDTLSASIILQDYLNFVNNK